MAGGIMLKRLLVGVAFSAMFLNASAQDYMFPSVNPPANIKADATIPQYVCIMWDDCSYSGLTGTIYESDTAQTWAQLNRIGGTPNVLNLQEGDIGVSWAERKVLPAGNNPDGSTRTMSFHVITGQMAAVTWKTSWTDTIVPGYCWGWKKQSYVTTEAGGKAARAPVCWGREFATFINGDSLGHGTLLEKGYTAMMYRDILAKGFEIGSHTLDHLETNSGLPKAFWPAPNYECWDPGIHKDLDINGDTLIETYATWDTIGWDDKAGMKLSQAGWKGVLQLASQELTDSLQISVANGKLSGFRAPRLEDNSGMLLALKELGYTYDCSVEEFNPLATGAMWPYTTDNGSPSVWSSMNKGDLINENTGKPIFDKYPSGLWELPVFVVVVPPELRDSVWAHANLIAKNAPDGDTLEPLSTWKKTGRITGYDFNLFIMWGMTKAQFVTTMEYNLDQCMNGNRAPFSLGLHPDYYTPIYDYATLLNSTNKASYGLVLTNGWNTWKTRQEAIAEFVAYAASKNCNFVGGLDLVKKMRALQLKDAPGTAYAATDAAWTFYTGAASTTSTSTFTGDITSAVVSVDKAESGCGYADTKTPGYFQGLDHISLTYSTTAPLKIKLTVKNDQPWYVILNNIGTSLNTGNIPLSAFQYDPNYMGTETAVNTANITAVSVEVAIPGLKAAQSVTMSATKIKFYGAAVAVRGITMAPRSATDISLRAFTNNMLNLFVGTKGIYTVNILSANGRMIKSFGNKELKSGLNNLRIGSDISRGLYVVNIEGNNLSKTMKTIVQ